MATEERPRPPLSRGWSGLRRRRPPAEPLEESEEWVISYMDMVTLIMCTFVVIAALLDVNQPPGNMALPSPLPYPFAADGQAAEPPPATLPPPPAASGEPPPPSASGEPPPPILATAQNWRAAVAAQGLGDLVAIVGGNRRITMEIQENILFASGRAELGPEGAEIIRTLAPLLAHSSGDVWVEGHSDDVRISNRRFPSNWELSASRAGAVVRALIMDGVAPWRLRAVGYADTRPVDVADNEAARARNRRVAIVIESEASQ
jgi:chemotaxis protein MotB